MKNTLYIFFYLLANLFRTYDIHLFFETFFGPAKTTKNRLPFYLFFCTLICGAHLFFSIPFLTLVLNLLCMFRLTFYYDADIKKRLLGLSFLIGLLCISEAVAILTNNFLSHSYLAKNNFFISVTELMIPVFPFIVILLYRALKKNSSRIDIRIPATYCIMAVSVSIFCIYIILLSFTLEGIQIWQFISIVFLMFATMISVFWLYEKQIKFFDEYNRKKVLEVQNIYYQKQLEYTLLTEHATRSLRHDMKDHLLAISSLAANNNDLAVVQYVDSLNHLFSPVAGSVSSGNVVIDSIVNSKLSLAAKKEIDLKADIAVPAKLSIDDIDITILLGNLLDNAIENFDQSAGKPIQFRLRYDKGRLLLHCENPYAGTLRRRGSSYDTGKTDRDKHGFGLQNINNVVAKYDGELKISEEDHLFCADLLLYPE
ncbi:MAG: GHKL domain-containing protein [Roseburia sp.]|nr:GHKL domain-containing protein [Roseburia sp.]